MNQPADPYPWRMGVAVLQNPDALMKEFGATFDPSQDRRRSPRIPLHVPIRYQLKGTRSDWNAAQAVNVSQGGVRFMTMQKNIKPGAQIELAMKLPGVSYLFELKGIIIWTKPVSQEGFAMECGVAFEDPKHP